MMKYDKSSLKEWKGKSKYFMECILSDSQIETLIQECKLLPMEWSQKFIQVEKKGHTEFHLSVPGNAGRKFEIIRRESNFNSANFSVVLGVYFPGDNECFRLRRYNGNNHTHTNQIEKIEVCGFHIHMTTEKYQRKHLQDERIQIDGYAESTTRYKDIEGALRCLIKDANFQEMPTLLGDMKNDI